MVKMFHRDVQARCINRLLIGAIGVIEDGQDKFRLIDDGTHTILINNRILARDLITSPLVNDLAVELQEAEYHGGKRLGLVRDFASARRVCQVHPDDWGLQACTLADLRNCTPSDKVARSREAAMERSRALTRPQVATLIWACSAAAAKVSLRSCSASCKRARA